MAAVLIDLTDGRYALRFPYHIVSQTTVFMALTVPRLLGKSVSFKPEDRETAGKYRLDSDIMAKTFPIEVAIARKAGLKLSDYILIQAK